MMGNNLGLQENKKNLAFSRVFVFLLMLLQAIQLAKIFKLESLESITFLILTLVVLFVGLVSIICSKSLNSLHFLSIIIIAFSIIASLIRMRGVSFDYFSKMILFCSTILLFTYVVEQKFHRTLPKTIFICSLIQTIVFVFAYFLGFGDELGKVGYLTFGFTNPNFTGMWIYCLISINVVYLFSKKHKKIWILFILMLVFLSLYFLIRTGNRASLLGLIIFIAGIVLSRFFKFKPFSSWVTTFIPIMVFIFYFIINSTVLAEFFSIFSEEGKELSSRMDIWNEGIELLKNNAILGDYYSVNYLLSFSQLHNIYLDVAASYGIIVLILFLCFFKKCILQTKARATSFTNVVAFWALIGFMIISSFEAALVSGSTGMYLLVAAQFILIKHEF